MKYDSKKILLGINKILAFVCFLITFLPRFKDVFVDHIRYYSTFSWFWFFLLVFSDITINWDVKDKKVLKTSKISGIVILALDVIYWIIILSTTDFSEISNWTKDIHWIGYELLTIVWALIGGVYLLLGLTKTKYDEGDKTIPYSD